jgi:hypothetical protein
MFRRPGIFCAITVWTLFAAGPASAQLLHHTQVYLSSASQTPLLTLVGDKEATLPAVGSQLDYALFATELIAFVTKEVLHDSRDEYRDSLLGSHLSPTMPPLHSDFGTHCLKVVSHIGSVMPSFGGGSVSLAESSPTLFDYAARAATTALALRGAWSAFTSDRGEDRTQFSLSPKVSPHRFALNFTVTW